MVTHSSILAWIIPWTEEPGGLQSLVSQSRTQFSDWAHIEAKASISGALLILTFKKPATSFKNVSAKSLQSCRTLCNSIDGSPPGSPIPGILQARTPEWVAISFSNAWKWKVKVKSLSFVRLLATPWTAAYQAPPSMAFSRQEYWSGVPLPSPKNVSTSVLMAL